MQDYLPGIEGGRATNHDLAPLRRADSPSPQGTLLPKADLRYVKALTHGGVALRKRRKTKRPLVPGAIHHLVLKSRQARGPLCLRKNRYVVSGLLKERSRKFFVEILEYVNMGNHLHIKVRFKDAERFKKFLKSFTAMLARKITGARRGKPFGRFWDGLAFTRILTSRLEELGLRAYFHANRLEQDAGYTVRLSFLDRHHRWVQRLQRVRARSVDFNSLDLASLPLPRMILPT